MEDKMDFRLSKQRKLILEELRKVDTHPTADEVYDMVRKTMPRISLGTVYRNLEFLCAKGLAIKVGPAGSQKRFDGNPAPHAHVRCLICGRVADVHSHMELPLPGEQIACGFQVTGVNVEFTGYCPACQGSEH